MKKKYSKPILLIESFQMVEHIAAFCVTKENVTSANYQDSSLCYYSDGAASLFQDGVAGCSIIDDYDPTMWPSLEEYVQAMMDDTTYQCYGPFSGGKAFAS